VLHLLEEVEELEPPDPGGGAGGAGAASSSGGAPAPSPPEPVAPRPPRKGAGRGGGGRRYDRFPVWDGIQEECGYFLVNENSKSFDMHCTRHAEWDCAVGRTWEPYVGAGAMTELRTAKGRPLSFLLGWARMSTRFPATAEGREAHMLASKFGKDAACADLFNGRSQIRKCCRDNIEAWPHLAPLRRLERQPRPDEPLEPPGRF